MTRELEIVFAIAQDEDITITAEELSFAEQHVQAANENDSHCFSHAECIRIASERQAWLDRAISKLPIGQ